MAKKKYADKLIALKCEKCKERNYYTTRNKKTAVAKGKKQGAKITIMKYCPVDREHTKHIETRITGK